MFDQAPLGRELDLDPATFQRVEIIRGPSSALYGTSAFFAVVNVTTKRGEDVNGVAISGGAGNLGRTKIGGIAGGRFRNGLDVAFSASVERRRRLRRAVLPGVRRSIHEQRRRHRTSTDESLRTVSGRMSYRDLQITGAYGRREKTVPTAAFGAAFNDDRFVTSDWRGFIDAALDRTWRGTDYAIRGYVDGYRYDGTYPEPVVESRASPTCSPPTTDTARGGAPKAERRAKLPGRQTLTAGLEFRDYADQSQGEAFEEDPAGNWDSDVTTHVFAAYGQDEVRLREKWLVSFGGRYDAYSGFDRLSPRASVVYVATPTRALKYLFGTAFRAPNAFEFDYLTQGVRNTDLRAETITTHEFVWEEYTSDWLRTTVSAYRSSVSRPDRADGQRRSTRPASKTRAASWRGGSSSKPKIRSAGNLFLGSYAFQRARDRDTDLELTNSPRHLGKLQWSLLGLIGESTLSLELQTTSQRLTVARTVRRWACGRERALRTPDQLAPGTDGHPPKPASAPTIRTRRRQTIG